MTTPLEEQFAALGPWIYQFQIGSQTCGGGTVSSVIAAQACTACEFHVMFLC